MGLEILESQCLTTVLLAVIAILLFLWLIYPQLSCSKESFNPSTSNSTNSSTGSQLSPPAPAVPVKYVDANTGTIMDGTDFMKPKFDNNDNPPINIIPPGSYLLDDGRGGQTGLATAKCSKSCCSSQWPLSFNLPYEADICDNKDKYVPNALYCDNSWQDSGCLCLTEDQYDYLSDRGGNAG